MADSVATKTSKDQSAAASEKRAPEVARQTEANDAQGQVLALHQAAGNRAVAQLLGSAISGATNGAAVIQRKCDCGSSCANCRQEDEQVQAKSSLPMSRPGDRYEQEADSIAEQVMRHISTPQGGGKPAAAPSPSAPQAMRSISDDRNAPPVMASREPGGEASGSSLPRGFMSSQGNGQPLPARLRSDMESAFGYDFGGVRVHSDERSAQTAQSIHSQAFTYGRNIFFNNGRFNPATRTGQRLLAHELAHVVQQGGAAPARELGAPRPVAARVQRFTPQRFIQRNLCLPHITRNGVGAVCKPPPSPTVVGSRVHSAVQRRFRRPPNQITELSVPGGAEVCREAGIPGLPATGGADLVRVVHRGPRVVRVQIAEIKPMNLEGAALGATQSACYAEKINDVGGLCARITPATARRIRREEPVGTATSLRPLLNMCVRLGALGRTVRASATLRIRPMTVTLPGRTPRRVVVRTCLPGVVGYTCVEREKRRRRRRQRRRQQPRRRTPAARRAQRQMARKIARLRRLRRQLVRRVLRTTLRTAARLGARVALRVATRAIPIVGWVLLAIDVAELIYNISRYGLNFGFGGEGGAGGGAEGEGGAGGGAEGEGGAEGAREGEGGAGGEGGGEGEREGGEAEGREGEGEKEGEGEGEGEGGQAGGEGQAGLEGLEGILTEEEVNEIVESLPLSPELIDALRNSTPQQQALLDLMLDKAKDPNAPRVDESFFMRVLEMSSGLTDEELERLHTMTRAAQGESQEEILEKLKKAIEQARKGATGGGEKRDQEEERKEGEPGEGEKRGEEGGQKGKGQGAGAQKGEGEGGAPEKTKKPRKPTGRGPSFTSPRPYTGKMQDSRDFLYAGGVPADAPAGRSYDVTIRFESEGRLYFSVVEFKVLSRTDESIELESTNDQPLDIAPEGHRPFIIKPKNRLTLSIVRQGPQEEK